MRAIPKAIAPSASSTIGEIDSPSVDTTSDDVADIINAAVEASGDKAMVIAMALGMSSSTFSEARTGKRTINLNRLLPWLRDNQDAALAFVNGLCAVLNLEPTKPKPRVDKKQVIERMLSFLRHTPEWECHMPKVASELGVSESDVRALVDQPTGSFRVAK